MFFQFCDNVLEKMIHMQVINFKSSKENIWVNKWNYQYNDVVYKKGEKSSRICYFKLTSKQVNSNGISF